MQTSFFTSDKSFFFCGATCCSIRGGEWRRPRIYLAQKWAIRARESNPGPTKWSCCTVRDLNPGPIKSDHVQGQGFEPWTDRERSCVRSCTRSLKAIAHAIVKFHVRTKHVQIHERVPRGTRPLDDGQRPDRTKNGRRTDRFKSDEWSEKICSLQEHIFLRYHIMYQIMYIFTGWISLQQYVCRIHTRKCSSCPFTW